MLSLACSTAPNTYLRLYSRLIHFSNRSFFLLLFPVTYGSVLWILQLLFSYFLIARLRSASIVKTIVDARGNTVFCYLILAGQYHFSSSSLCSYFRSPPLLTWDIEHMSLHMTFWTTIHTSTLFTKTRTYSEIARTKHLQPSCNMPFWVLNTMSVLVLRGPCVKENVFHKNNHDKSV